MLPAYDGGAEVTVLGNTGAPVKTRYIFAGWNTQEDGGGMNYSVGATFPITGNTNLYAQWTPIGEDPNDPVHLTYTERLTPGNWAALLALIQERDRYVALDLDACAMEGAEFDARPGESDAGESKVVSLILPHGNGHQRRCLEQWAFQALY
jgi:uncharacterized repeat protein (TIGR02543 family)